MAAKKFWKNPVQIFKKKIQKLGLQSLSQNSVVICDTSLQRHLVDFAGTWSLRVVQYASNERARASTYDNLSKRYSCLRKRCFGCFVYPSQMKVKKIFEGKYLFQTLLTSLSQSLLAGDAFSKYWPPSLTHVSILSAHLILIIFLRQGVAKGVRCVDNFIFGIEVPTRNGFLKCWKQPIIIRHQVW